MLVEPGPSGRPHCIFVLNWLCPLSESESHVMTDGKSAGLFGNKAAIWGLRPNFYYCHTAAGLLTWGALSYERTGLSFTIAVGARQCSHSRARVPWNPQLYFTLSDSRLPFSSPPTNLRAKTKLRGFSPQANYTDRATAACRRS
jgi:hypothetical protein